MLSASLTGVWRPKKISIWAWNLAAGIRWDRCGLTDFIGLDTILFIADIMFDEFKDGHYAAPPLLRRMVNAGYLGKKAGRGFYDYQRQVTTARRTI